MKSVPEALATAATTAHWTIGMCDNFVANMFGFKNSGYTTALVHWNSIPSADKHPGDTNAPAGALMFWGGGFGHVAISDGNGGIYTTDMPVAGSVGHVPASDITTKWGKPYLGWSLPYFGGQSDAMGKSPVGSVQQAGSTSGISGDILTGGLQDGISNAIDVGFAGILNFALTVGIWTLELGLGAGLFIIGIVVLAKGVKDAANV